MTKRTRHLIFSIILAGCTLAFIWLNSAMDGEKSSMISGRFRELFEAVLNFIRFPAEPMAFLLENVRKVAHAVEYFVFGAELAFLWLGLVRKFQGVWNAISIALAGSVLDESIQLFAKDRGASIADVLLDTGSAIIGILIVYILWIIIESITKSRNKRKRKAAR